MIYASANINLEIENHYYTKTTKLCGTIVYKTGDKDEEYNFKTIVHPQTHFESFGALVLQVPNKRFKSVSLVLLKKDAPEDGTATAYAIGNHNFSCAYISKLEAKISKSNITIKPRLNLPPKFTND